MRTIPMLRRAAVTATVALVLAQAGCLDEKSSMTIHEDGSGTVRVESTTKPGGPMGMMGGGGDDDKKMTKEDAEKICYSALAEWDGVAAWTDVKCEATDKGAHYTAT